MVYMSEIALAIAKKYFNHSFDKDGATSCEYWEKRKMLTGKQIHALFEKNALKDYYNIEGYHYMYNKNEMFIRLHFFDEEGHFFNPKYIAYIEDDVMKCEDV